MKKVTFLLATLLIGGLMLTGCKKNDPQPTPDPTPTPTTAKVIYEVTNKQGVFAASDCFKYTITYVGADGNSVTVNDVTLPWTSPEITVNLPFNAKVEGKATYNEASIPDIVTFGRTPSITADGKLVAIGNDAYQAVSKERFLALVAENSDMLSFSLSEKVE